MTKFIHRKKDAVVLAASFSAAVVFAVVMIGISDFLVNVGFFVAGGLLTVLTTLLVERVSRNQRAFDVASAMQIELADRVARCCFDWEKPWSVYLDTNVVRHDPMLVVRLRKFVPEPPIIFRANAQHVALLGKANAQALIKFYYRLAAWERDLNNIAVDCERSGGEVPLKKIQFLARRLRQTLAPGLAALDGLGHLVEDHDSVERIAIASYDETLEEQSVPEGSLRDRLSRAIR